jgi:hypothetical protein
MVVGTGDTAGFDGLKKAAAVLVGFLPTEPEKLRIA